MRYHLRVFLPVTQDYRRNVPAQKIYDAIVIGGGHQGLTAAAYLARAGLGVIVLERREILGGCCQTEVIAPGCSCSTASYLTSMLRPEVTRDLRLPDHGLRMLGDWRKGRFQAAAACRQHRHPRPGSGRAWRQRPVVGTHTHALQLPAGSPAGSD